MALTTVVVLLVAVADSSAPTTVAMAASLVEALGPSVSVVLRSTATLSDAEALKLEHELNAEAVARVTWSGPDQTTAALRTHLLKTGSWIERQVAFKPGDSRSERGRTLGFSVAALILAAHDPAEGEAAPAGSVSTRAAPPAVFVPSTSNETRARASLLSAPADSAGRGRASFALAMVGATGIGGPANALGATACGEYLLGRSLYLRGGASVRTGTVPGLQGDNTIAGLEIGAAFRPFLPDRTHFPFGLAVVVEGLVLYHDLSHHDAYGHTLHRGRLMPGIAPLVEGSWSFARSFDVFLTLGSEIGFGPTDVVVAGQVVAVIPAVRAVGQAGFRLHF